ncbi:24795_t:CDS:2 [Gigaspora rosea]|nr:24795_t:CDS:2 [Gigaspora rosea]
MSDTESTVHDHAAEARTANHPTSTIPTTRADTHNEQLQANITNALSQATQANTGSIAETQRDILVPKDHAASLQQPQQSTDINPSVDKGRKRRNQQGFPILSRQGMKVFSFGGTSRTRVYSPVLGMQRTNHVTISLGGTISIKRQSCHTTFVDFSEWLLAFKAYMDAVLVIYGNREHELNSYRDHINELYLKQSFHAITSYDEDHRITLVTN